jgi:hypothetical protein
MAESIVERLLALGWRYNAQGVLCQPPSCRRVPLWIRGDDIGERLEIRPPSPRDAPLWIRGIHWDRFDPFFEEER